MDYKLYILGVTFALCLGYQIIQYSEYNLKTPTFLHLNFTNGSLAILNRVYEKLHHILNNTRRVVKEEVHLKYTPDVDEHYENIQRTEVYVKTVIFDNRTGQAVKIWALSLNKKTKLFCHVDYGKNMIRVVEAAMHIQSTSVPSFCKWFTAVIDCPLRSKIPPVKVSISASKTITNSWHKVLIRLFKPPVTPKYGICLTTVFDITTRMKLHSLVEWFEMQKLLGVHNVMLYGIHNVSVSILKVLKHYIDSGFLVYHPLRLPLPSYAPLHLEANTSLKSVNRCISYYAQHLNYMDCIYRYADDFTYLALIDTDEYFIPQQGYTWHDMFKNIEKVKQSQNMASYLMQSSVFPVQENYVHANNLRIFLRTKSIRRQNPPVHLSRYPTDSELSWRTYIYFKSIVRPYLVNSFYVHKVEAVVPGWIPRGVVPPNIGRYYHYRIPNITPGWYLNVTVYDNTMFKYHKRLIKGMVDTLRKTVP